MNKTTYYGSYVYHPLIVLSTAKLLRKVLRLHGVVKMSACKGLKPCPSLHVVTVILSHIFYDFVFLVFLLQLIFLVTRHLFIFCSYNFIL